MGNQPTDANHVQPVGASPVGAPQPESRKNSRSLLGLLFSPLRSKMFMLACLGVLFGGGTMVANAMKEGSAAGSMPSLAMDAAPWALRVGISFIVAFVFAFLVRKAIKWGLILGGLLVGGAILVHKLGLGLSADDVASLKQHVDEVARTAQHAADTLWANIKTYLPSAGSAGIGLWRGAKHDVTP